MQIKKHTLETSTQLGQEYGYFKGIGNISRGGSVLAPQAIPKSKKKDKWKKTNMDGLEREGLRQYVENLPMNDYYRMLSGEMAYIDVVEEDADLVYSYIQDFKKNDLKLPSYLKHWDLMYPVVSKIIGDWAMQYDKLRFDTTDDTSTNDYITERTIRLSKYTEALFKQKLDKAMIQSGIDIKENFQSEEEYQQYQEQQNALIKDYFPEKIEQDMKKNWKTEAAQWAEKTWARDYERYRMAILESLEARDILLTGKSFRHYRVGYDYYTPEYWHPIESFHSKEASATRVEDGEFAGRIKFYTIGELINAYGDKLSEHDRINIYKAYLGEEYEEYAETTSFEQNTAFLGEGAFEQMMVPFKGYSDHKLSLEFEQATGIPLSERTDFETGEVRPSFSVPVYNSSIVSYGSRLSQKLRTDIQVRTDTIQTTEAYFRGSKKIGLLTYRAPNGYLTSTEVDEDLITDVLKEYNIKKVRKISLAEFNLLGEDKRENTVIWMDTPVVYSGVKIRVPTQDGDNDIYLVDEMPYQIRGEKGNMFDVKLPVCGHIGDSFCKKIRPEQITVNYLLNQNQNYLEKEIGSFFVIDVNTIPTEYFDVGDNTDALFAIRNIAKTTGILPTDFSRNALNAQGGLTFNPMVYQNVTYTDQIQRNIGLVERYKWMAYEKLGLTPTSMGSPSQYATNEGIQVGQKAYFAQTFGVDQMLMENKRANVEIHMAVAQYCQLNNKDANYIYMASDDELSFLQSIQDDEFSNRKIDVRSTYDPKKNMNFQQLKQALIQNNTMGADAMSMTELFLSDDFMELKEAALKARQYAEKVQKTTFEQNKQIAEIEAQKELKMHDDEISVKRDKNEATVKAAELNASGRVGDNIDDGNAYQVIQDSANNYLKEKEIDNKNAQEFAKIKNDLYNASQNFANKAQEMSLNQEKLEIEREKLATMKYVSDNNRYQSVINKN